MCQAAGKSGPVRIDVPRVSITPPVARPAEGFDARNVYRYPYGYVARDSALDRAAMGSAVRQFSPPPVSPNVDPSGPTALNGVLLSRDPRERANQLAFPARADVRYTNRLVADAQENLRRLGYYAGTVDGNFGPQTERAVQRYQIDHRRTVTGTLDRATLSELGIVTDRR